MRELKFRIWDGKKNEWLGASDNDNLTFYGFHLVGEVMTVQCPPYFALDDGNVVEQYTGLQDRGKEIYEGDIIRWANSVGREITAPVVWNTRAWCWTAGDYMLGGLLEFDLEVIGNIHENPELLEAKQ